MGEARAFWEDPARVLSREQPRGERRPDRRAVAVLGEQWLVVDLATPARTMTVRVGERTGASGSGGAEVAACLQRRQRVWPRRAGKPHRSTQWKPEGGTRTQWDGRRSGTAFNRVRFGARYTAVEGAGAGRTSNTLRCSAEYCGCSMTGSWRPRRRAIWMAVAIAVGDHSDVPCIPEQRSVHRNVPRRKAAVAEAPQRVAENRPSETLAKRRWAYSPSTAPALCPR